MTGLGFFIREACIGLRRSGLMMALSLCTLGVSVFVFGFFLLLSLNLNNLADFFVSRLEIRVFLRDDVTRRDKRDFTLALKAYPDIRSVTFIDKETAWQTLKKQYAGTTLTDYVRNNPLPDSIIIRVTDETQLNAIIKQLDKPDLIEDIVYGGDVTQRIQTLSKWIKLSGWLVNAMLLLATLMIIINTIRLTIMARSHEVRIMQLVGATQWFIRWPFIIEGFLLGITGSSLAVLTLYFGYNNLLYRIQGNMPFIPLVYDTPLTVYSTVFMIGTLLGIAGAYISITRTLLSYDS